MPAARSPCGAEASHQTAPALDLMVISAPTGFESGRGDPGGGSDPNLPTLRELKLEGFRGFAEVECGSRTRRDFTGTRRCC